MIQPLKAIRRILWGNLTLNGEKVQVLQRDYPMDKTPCVTIDDSGGVKFIDRYILNVPYPLNKDHPQYDVENPFRKVPQEVLREYYETTINLNIWCDTGDEREQLTNNIRDLFYKAQTDHYLYCNNYHDGDCSYMDNTCYAKHFTLNKRGVKHQCPNPNVYGYQNIFTTYHLIRASFHLDPPYNLNDRSKDSMIYRSVLKLHTGYYDDYIIGGKTSNRLTVKENLI